MRKDWQKSYPKWLLDMIKSAPFDVEVEKDVAEILDEDTTGVNVKRGDIDTVVWSHHHWVGYSPPPPTSSFNPRSLTLSRTTPATYPPFPPAQPSPSVPASP